MRHADCIFGSEDECPKDNINLSCEACGKQKLFMAIEQSARDFVSLGASLTEIFKMYNELNNGEATELPHEQVRTVHRIMTSLLSTEENISVERVYYRRLIFYYFGIIVDEFFEKEYNSTTYGYGH